MPYSTQPHSAWMTRRHQYIYAFSFVFFPGSFLSPNTKTVCDSRGRGCLTLHMFSFLGGGGTGRELLIGNKKEGRKKTYLEKEQNEGRSEVGMRSS